MRISYRTLIGLIVTLLVGIFIGFLIVKKELLTFHSDKGLWEAVGAVGSIFAIVIALTIAIIGWIKSDKARVEDKLEAERARQEERRQKDIESAKIAFCHFRRLSRIATLLSSKSHAAFKTGQGQAKHKIEEIYEGWKYANTSHDCVSSIIFADRKASELVDQSDLIDTFEQILQVAISGGYLSDEKIEKGVSSQLLDVITDALYAFKELSYLYILELIEPKDSNLIESVIKDAQRYLGDLRSFQEKVKEANANKQV